MIIKRATRQDAADILALQKLAYQSEAAIYNDYTIKPLIQTQNDIEEEFKDYVFLKVTEGDVIIGSVRARLIKDDSCYIGRLIVHPNHQNQGIGKKLLEEVEKIFKSCGRFELTAGHRSQKNLTFYRKLGFSPYKTEKVNDRINLVYLEKR
jgi:ribosomal protein S18 acetylase RimI-like enzyme